ncbi:hypothetical protein GX51_05735 [Blastomyces parvus]|uniref:Uncharacterized protein n=1 Tax=Blastomyces parvus TaxID=2060905 RepID=A0A2B7WVB1_9EURO|nr:hypothetical protein GX51_05735 [Blastomyces parvus]
MAEEPMVGSDRPESASIHQFLKRLRIPAEQHEICCNKSSRFHEVVQSQEKGMRNSHHRPKGRNGS